MLTLCAVLTIVLSSLTAQAQTIPHNTSPQEFNYNDPQFLSAVAVEGIKLSEAKPVSNCFSLVLNPVYTMQSTCPEIDHQCVDPCDSCVIFGLTWNGECAIDGFRMEVEDNICFFGCVELDLPTHPALDADRVDCDNEPVEFGVQAPYYTPIQPGTTIMVRICANKASFPLKVHIGAFDCNGEPCNQVFTI